VNRPGYEGLIPSTDTEALNLAPHRHPNQFGGRMCHEHDGMLYHCHDLDVNEGQAYDVRVPSPHQTAKPAVTLNPNDPFEKQLISIVETNRRKRKDYALDGDPFSNFRMTSELLGIPGFGTTEAALFNVIQKLIRLHSLRKNGRIHDTTNESVTDTYLDAAVYAVITFAIEMERLDPNRVHCED
jgi:hypothetical protein